MDEEKEECLHKFVVPYCMDCEKFVFPFLGPEGGWQEALGTFTIELSLQTKPGPMSASVTGWEIKVPAAHGANWEEWFAPGSEFKVSGVRISVMNTKDVLE